MNAFCSKRVWSLWEIMKLLPPSFLDDLNTLSSTDQALRAIPPPQADRAAPELLRHLIGSITGLRQVLVENDLDLAVISFDRLMKLPDPRPFPITANDVTGSVGQLKMRMLDALQARKMLMLSKMDAEFYDAGPNVFGPEVANRFSTHTTDMDEAGKCIGLGRFTACVFHLMRIMEVALREMGTKLGATIKEKDAWLTILQDRLEPKIIALPETTDDERRIKREFQQTRAHLHAVRLAWRNDTMHPKDTYTEQEALDLIGHVRTFLQALVKLI